MKKINQLAIAVALGLTVATAVQAETVVVPATRQTIVQRRVVMERPIARRPAVIAEAPMQTGVPATVVSGSTLAGRREVISNDAVFVPSGTRGRVVYSRGDGAIRNRPVREVLSPGTVSGAEPSIAFGGTRMGY